MAETFNLAADFMVTRLKCQKLIEVYSFDRGVEDLAADRIELIKKARDFCGLICWHD